MSAPRRHSESRPEGNPPPPTAEFRPSRWPGLIWAVPLAALGIIAWLGIRDWLTRGPSVTVDFPTVAAIKAGSTDVKYRGYTVGSVDDVSFSPGLDHLIVKLSFDSAMKGHLGPGTRYWIAGAAGDVSSVQSLMTAVTGPYVGVDPQPGETVRQATGLAAEDSPGPGSVSYRAVFAGGPQGLKPGAAVQLEGLPAGAVTHVVVQYDAAHHALQTAAEFEVDPNRIQWIGGAGSRADPAVRMNQAMEELVARGLRAELGSAVPVIGGKIVELTMVPGQPPAHLGPGVPPEIPTAPGGDVQQVVQQVNAILAEVKALPIAPIAANIHDVTSRLAAVADAAETRRALERLDQADAQLPGIMANIKQASAETQQALSEVQSLLNAQKQGNAAPDTTDLPHALFELTSAARSLRELTDYLNSHPNALIFGRKD